MQFAGNSKINAQSDGHSLIITLISPGSTRTPQTYNMEGLRARTTLVSVSASGNLAPFHYFSPGPPHCRHFIISHFVFKSVLILLYVCGLTFWLFPLTECGGTVVLIIPMLTLLAAPGEHPRARTSADFCNKINWLRDRQSGPGTGMASRQNQLPL